VLRRFLAAGDFEVAPARRARADEDRVPFLREQLLHALDLRPALELDAEVEHVTHLLVDHLHREPEARDLRPDHAARARVLVEHRDLVAERREVARHRERSGPGADAGDALAVLRRRGPGHLRLHARRFLIVGGNALQTADRDRLGLLLVMVFDAAAPASGLAGAITGAAEDSGEDVGAPGDHVGVVIATRRDQPYVYRTPCMLRTVPLAIYDFIVEVRDS